MSGERLVPANLRDRFYRVYEDGGFGDLRAEVAALRTIASAIADRLAEEPSSRDLELWLKFIDRIRATAHTLLQIEYARYYLVNERQLENIFRLVLEAARETVTNTEDYRLFVAALRDKLSALMSGQPLSTPSLPTPERANQPLRAFINAEVGRAVEAEFDRAAPGDGEDG